MFRCFVFMMFRCLGFMSELQLRWLVCFDFSTRVRGLGAESHNTLLLLGMSGFVLWISYKIVQLEKSFHL